MKGQYTGFYKYDNKRIDNILGRTQTFFDIDITEVEDGKFYGTVQDEPIAKTGPGIISGELIGEQIFFIKQMAIRTIMTDDGQQKSFNKRHPKIYYKGIKVDNKFKGTWKIKFGFIFIGIIPIPMATTRGTWEMRIK